MKDETIDKMVDTTTAAGSILLTLGCMIWFIPLIVIVIGLTLALFESF